MTNRGLALAGAIVTLALAGCTKDEPVSKPVRSQREKDSILANSQIPGAKAVKRAMKSADSASARQARLDTAQESP